MGGTIKTVFILWHVRPEVDGQPENAKKLGVFATREDAEAWMMDARSLPGFTSFPEAFQIVEAPIGRREWPEGFYWPGEDAEEDQAWEDFHSGETEST